MRKVSLSLVLGLVISVFAFGGEKASVKGWLADSNCGGDPAKAMSAGHNWKTTVWRTDPTRPMGSWKVAWKNVQRIAGIKCRFHDLRHSAFTRLLEAGVSFPVVAEILG